MAEAANKTSAPPPAASAAKRVSINFVCVDAIM